MKKSVLAMALAAVVMLAGCSGVSQESKNSIVDDGSSLNQNSSSLESVTDINSSTETPNSLVSSVSEVEQTTDSEQSTAEIQPSKPEITPNQDEQPVQDTATTGEKNALKKAKSYLDIMAFSREGLIEQLEYEGFSNSEAAYGADNVGADWNEQAVKKAKSYLDIMAFSREGLIDQLEFEGFTHDQAVYGAAQNGY